MQGELLGTTGASAALPVIAEAAAPGVVSMTGSGGFTQEETDELYREVREQVQLETQALENETICNFYGLNEDGAGTLNALPEEPEFYEVETTLDTGATTHAADRVDFPGYEVEESPGSRAGQFFGCACGESLANE